MKKHKYHLSIQFEDSNPNFSYYDENYNSYNGTPHNKVGLNDIFTNPNMMNVIEDDFFKKPKNKKSKNKWSKKKKIWVFSIAIAAGVVTIAGCGAGVAAYVIKQNSTLYSNGSPLEYNSSSKATQWISQRTLSLLFGYKYTNSTDFQFEAGTGWIYQANQLANTFYIATNLHVANILSYVGNSNVQTFSNSNLQTKSYSDQLLTYVGITTSGANTSKYSNDIVYFLVSNPEVTFTTTSNSEFNNIFNKTARQYNGLVQTTKYNGAQDIAILKYTINPYSISTTGIMTNKNSNLSSSTKNKYLQTFQKWIFNYFANPTSIYTGYVENISLDNKSLYMAGFPSYNKESGSQGSSLSDISWISFSDFTTYGSLQYPAKVFAESYGSDYLPLSYPIGFYDSSKTNYRDYNYVSIGIQSMINASSFAGSSGSPIVMKDSSGSFQIAGIYWGELSTSDRTFYKGLMTWFNTNAYYLSDGSTAEYKLTTQIDAAISKIK